MGKSHDAKKDVKKKAAKTLKEKRLEKKVKRKQKISEIDSGVTPPGAILLLAPLTTQKHFAVKLPTTKPQLVLTYRWKVKKIVA